MSASPPDPLNRDRADHDRDRSSETGRFVTDEYAEHHPATTTSEPVEPRGSSKDRALAQNMAAMLTEQLGVMVHPEVVAERAGAGYVLAIDLETAQRIYSARAVLATATDGTILTRWTSP